MMKVSRIGNPPNTTLKFDFNQIFRSTFKTLTLQIDVNGWSWSKWEIVTWTRNEWNKESIQLKWINRILVEIFNAKFAMLKMLNKYCGNQLRSFHMEMRPFQKIWTKNEPQYQWEQLIMYIYMNTESELEWIRRTCSQNKEKHVRWSCFWNLRISRKKADIYKYGCKRNIRTKAIEDTTHR